MKPFETKRDVDQWLEKALGQYGAAEPRPGIEGRILANLEIERHRLPSRAVWRWSYTLLAFATVLALAIWLGWYRSRSPADGAARVEHQPEVEQQGKVHQPEVGQQSSVVHEAPDAESGESRRSLGLRPPIRRQPVSGEASTAALAVLSKAPKGERFPTPSPLSEQEQMLVRYVQDFPQRAVLIAGTQAAIRTSEEMEMAGPWPSDANYPIAEHQQQK